MTQTYQAKAIALQQTNAAQILQLRHQALRQDHAIAEVMFAEDNDPSSHHYGAFNPAGVNLLSLAAALSMGRTRSMETTGQWQKPLSRQRIKADEVCDRLFGE